MDNAEYSERLNRIFRRDEMRLLATPVHGTGILVRGKTDSEWKPLVYYMGTIVRGSQGALRLLALTEKQRAFVLEVVK